MAHAAAVVVLGSGPAGPSCAAELAARGCPPPCPNGVQAFAAAWSGRYDALRFDTSRLHSALPGAPLPRDFGQFPTRDKHVG